MTDDALMISALNHYFYCHRRCALIHIEGIWSDNAHTITGILLHDRADTPGYENETESGVTLIRALPLFSKKYGLTGKADVVEMHGKQPVPVEYKKGRRKQWDNDDMQLCAQALCLEEMFDCNVTRGYIYHVSSKRRREVSFDQELRGMTEATIQAVRQLIAHAKVPAAILKPQCKGCSLYNICLPVIDTVESCHSYLWAD